MKAQRLYNQMPKKIKVLEKYLQFISMKYLRH